MKPGASNWVMQRAAILGDGSSPETPLDLLTPGAKYDFIEEVINEIQFGTPDLQFLCGRVPAMPAFAIQDLHDEQKYYQFHRNWVDTYEIIAQGLNHPGSVSLPIWDITLALPDIDISFPNFSIPWFTIDLPKILLELKLSLPQLLLDLKLPSFPPDISIDLPIPPSPFEINLPQLSFMFKAILKLPSLIIDLALKLALDLPSLFPIDIPKLFLTICKTLREKIFPKDPENEGILDVTNAAAASVLARKTTELSLLSLLGMMVGSGSLIVGGAAVALGTKPEDQKEIIEPIPIEPGLRGKIIEVAQSAVDLHSSRSPAHDEMRRQYAEFLFPNDDIDNSLGWVETPTFSSCGVFVRSCYKRASGGDIPESFPGSSRAAVVNMPYANRIGNVISDLRELARSRDAIKYDVTEYPLKRLLSIDIQQGDTIFVSDIKKDSNGSIIVDSLQTHVLIVSNEEEQDGQRIVHGIQGGTPNLGRDPSETGLGELRVEGQRISEERVTLYEQLDKKIRVLGLGNRYVIEIWDAEKMIRG